MSQENANQMPALDLDADAVCGQCGTVNPEATLLCKVCGTNLRDQRQLRLQAEQVLESVGEAPASRGWVTGILTLVGAIIIIVVALSANNIANSVVNGGLDSDSVDTMWVGPQHAAFDALRTQIKATELTADTITAAFEPIPAPAEGAEAPPLDGLYVLMPPNSTPEAPPYGTAALKLEGDEYLFTAILSDGTELRGWATQRGNGLLTAEAQRAAALASNKYQSVYGYAQRLGDGSFSGFGNFQESEGDLLGFVAYRLP